MGIGGKKEGGQHTAHRRKKAFQLGPSYGKIGTTNRPFPHSLDPTDSLLLWDEGKVCDTRLLSVQQARTFPRPKLTESNTSNLVCGMTGLHTLPTQLVLGKLKVISARQPNLDQAKLRYAMCGALGTWFTGSMISKSSCSRSIAAMLTRFWIRPPRLALPKYQVVRKKKP